MMFLSCKHLSYDKSLQVMVMKLWKHVANLANQSSGPTVANIMAEQVQMTYAINAILQVWMVLLEPILEDILDVCKI
jgi:hypothetical protein